MQAIFDLLYLVVFMSYLLMSLFIVYHIVKYSISKTVTAFTLLFFLVGTALLLFANAILFFSIPFDQLTLSLPTSTYSTHSPLSF